MRDGSNSARVCTIHPDSMPVDATDLISQPDRRTNVSLETVSMRVK